VAVVERLDAERIAREEKQLLALVPDGEREHPAQPAEAALTPVREGGEQHLGVAIRAKRPAGGGEFVAQRAKVVDGAIEDQREPPVGRVHRLVAVGGIEDGEAPHAKRRGAA